jgi:hypothetical protein
MFYSNPKNNPSSQTHFFDQQSDRAEQVLRRRLDKRLA